MPRLPTSVSGNAVHGNFSVHLEGQRVDDRHRLDVERVEDRPRQQADVLVALDVELDGLGVERRAVVERHVRAQLQRPRLLVARSPATRRAAGRSRCSRRTSSASRTPPDDGAVGDAADDLHRVEAERVEQRGDDEVAALGRARPRRPPRPRGGRRRLVVGSRRSLPSCPRRSSCPRPAWSRRRWSRARRPCLAVPRRRHRRRRRRRRRGPGPRTRDDGERTRGNGPRNCTPVLLHHSPRKVAPSATQKLDHVLLTRQPGTSAT